MAIGASSFTKFRLILWKNWLLIKNHKFQVFLEIFLPILFASVVVYTRYIYLPQHRDIVNFHEFPINLEKYNEFISYFKKVKYVIIYSPKNYILDKIVADAVIRLRHIESYLGVSNADSLESIMLAENFMVGIEFDPELKHIRHYPETLHFSLRFPRELRIGNEDQIIWDTNMLYPQEVVNTPRSPENNFGSFPNYAMENFLSVQHAVSMSFLNLLYEQRNQSAEKIILPKIVMQRFPYPAHRYDKPLLKMVYFMSISIMLSIVYSVTTLTRSIADEKEKHLTEVIKMMGVESWTIWAAWFIRTLIIWTIAFIIALIIFKIRWSSNVAVLTYSNSAIMFLFFLIYIICGICFSFMISVLFAKASLAGIIAGVAWFFTFAPYIAMGQRDSNLTYWGQLFWCLLPNTAMAIGLKVVLNYEKVEEGIHRYNLFETIKPQNVSVGVVMGTMLIDAFVCMIICLYCEQIFPGKSGIPKKWYFPFTSAFWCPNRAARLNTEPFDEMTYRSDSEAFEEEPRGKNIGIQVLGLKKRYNDKMVVKGITMNMYEDEITVLLGHNGAGKTTTLSMLVGMFPPTFGTAIINGYDIRTNIKGARESMGVCPQHNVLFDDMNIQDHIYFFSCLKGSQKQTIEQDINKYIQIFGMEKKANTVSAKLSGGMKRKLSLCCALCGGTKVVLCDEPSSGMDPAARRQLWDLLLSEKAGRTLILTTHYMDEADILGDRIAIMSNGELKCYGTPFFLKQKFGSGYKLVCEKREDCNVSEVTALLNKYITGIQPASDIGTELTYNLSGDMSNNFEKMFRALENQSQNLGLNGYGVSRNSLEEVFFKVGAEKSVDLTGRYLKKGKEDEEIFIESISRNCMKYCCRQWEAMFIKKALFTWYNMPVVVIRTLLTSFFITISVLGGQGGLSELPKLPITLTKYPKAVAVLEVKPDVEQGMLMKEIAREYRSIVESNGKNYVVESTGKQNMSDYILSINEKQWHIDSEHIAGATISKDKIIAWINSQLLHTPPLTLNLIHNAIAHALIQPNVEIVVTNHPLPRSNKRSLYLIFENVTSQNSLGLQIVQNIVLCMALITSFYVYLPIKERVTRSKLLQFVSGVQVWIFWFTQFLWDMFTFLLAALIVILTLATFREEGFSTPEELVRIFAVFAIFAYAVLPCTYLASFLFTDAIMGFAVLFVVNFITGLVLAYITILLYDMGFETVSQNLDTLFGIFPHFALEASLFRTYLLSIGHKLCGPLVNTMFCVLHPRCCHLHGFWDWNDGVIRYIIYFTSVGTAAFIVLLLIDYHVFRFKGYRIYTEQQRLSNADLDEDVIAEKNRIAVMTQYEIDRQYLVLDRVTKYYNHFPAVSQVSLCVKHKECFGLLGVNGAGKTTTFKMMTGDLTISSGSAFVRGINLKSNLNEVYRQIGYCPQFDALIDDLSGRQLLLIYCLLRGIPRDHIRSLSELLAKSFGFIRHIDKRTKFYSGGNKRKLSAAIAVLGNPSVIYLDEPTAGMDPGARRNLWNMIGRIREAGKSIVLTSHSMEECEALCTRLAIMVNGEFKCIGSIQHLKNKFSKGLILKVKVKRRRDNEPVLPGKSGRKEPDQGRQPERDSEPEQEEKKLSDQVDSQKSQPDRKISEPEADEDFDTAPEEEPFKKSDEKLETSKPPKADDEAGKEADKESSVPQKEDARILTRNEKKFDREQQKRLPAELLEDIKNVKMAVKKKYPNAVLEEEFQRMLTFYVPLVDVKWSEIFGFMEQNRVELRIEDYSISQTTLEEIFLEFAKQQRMDTRIHRERRNCCGRSKP